VNDAHPDEWRYWLETSGRKLRLSRQRQRFSGSDQAMEAAVGGLGIAIGRRPMVDVYLRERRLVAPFGTDGATGYSYYLIRGKSRSSEAAQRVYEWLIARAEAAPTKAG
jgi:LysR family transcriptional regulator, glycine cleavage system transcriptional activator